MQFCKKSQEIKQLEGAWEERGVIGTRIEIKGAVLTVLWRNTPVLETKYKPVPCDGGTELKLDRCGMRYPNSASDYASVTRLFYKDGQLTFDELFPISGPSSSVLTKTENSRYGNYTVTDGILKELQGKWIADCGPELVFKGDTLTMYDRTIRIHVLQSNSEKGSGCYLIVDADPSNYELHGISRLAYRGGMLSGMIPICDAKPIILNYVRAD